MPLILYDWECENCGGVFEAMAEPDRMEMPCHLCETREERTFHVSVARRVLGVGRGNHRPDAPWIESVLDVVGKTSKDPATRRFLETPNRVNHAAWMKSRGLRHYEEGERPIPKVVDPDSRVMAGKILKKRQEDRAIHLRG